MKHLLIYTLALAALVAVAIPAAAEGRKGKRGQRDAAKVARAETRRETTHALAVRGEELQANIDKVNGLAWHDDVASALKAAAKEDKPVFLLHVLGERCGST
jgi:hypothetical protein